MATTDKNVCIENAFCYVSDYTESTLKNLKNHFLKDVLKNPSNLQKHLNMEWDLSSPYQTPIFCNKKLLVGKKISSTK